MSKNLSIFLFIVGTFAFAQEKHPTLTDIVTDNAHIFSQTELQKLSKKLTDFERETTDQIAVLTIEKLEKETIEHFGYKTFEANRLEQDKDNGLLIIVSEKNREVRIEVGNGLEPYITDAIVSRIIRQSLNRTLKKMIITKA